MANSKQKPVPEGVKRSPGKSKFSIPRKDAPPIDGSYLDRLFADYDKQTQELQGQDDAIPTQAVESLAPSTRVEQLLPQVEESDRTRALTTPDAGTSGHISPVDLATLSHKEATAEHGTETPEAVRSEPTQAIRAPETVARIPKPKPAAITPKSPDSDTQLLDKWKKKHRLGKGEVKVIRVMLGMCHETGGDYCYIKIPQLMQAAELKERQTQLVLRSLRELGLIEKIGEYSNQDRLGTKYRVLTDAD